MNTKSIMPVSSGSFVYDIGRWGAVHLRLLGVPDAEAIAKSVEGHYFTPRPTQYGSRGVVQNFSACEEEDIPNDSVVRELSGHLTHLLGKMFGSQSGSARVFPEEPICLNDHLLLLYPPSKIGLGAHRDHSKYINLIISLTLIGESDFNIHTTPEGLPVKTFHATSGTAVFMRAPDFLGEDIRPLHSVSRVSTERLTLVLKQKRRPHENLH